MADKKFCESCDSKGVRHKKNCPLLSFQAEQGSGNEEIPATTVSKEEFDSFKNNVEQTQNKILDLLEKSLEKKESPVKVVSEGGPKELSLPEEYRGIFEKYFDPADGFQAGMDFPEKGHFGILVPKKFSNESSAYQDYYKRVVHSARLPGLNPAQEIEERCKLVARNLRYNRNLQTKEYAI